MTEALLKISINDQYIPLANDIMRVVIILLVINVLMFITDPSKNTLFGDNYIKLSIFVILGICTYRLTINKLVMFIPPEI